MLDLALKSSVIFIVDDDASTTEFLKKYLQSLGYTNIHVITDSRNVIPQIELFKPDLILLDLIMPFINGFELIPQIRAKMPTDYVLPILVVTADTTIES